MTMASRGLCLGLLLAALGPSPTARAHEIRPALLHIEETAPGLFEVTWKLPGKGDRALGLHDASLVFDPDHGASRRKRIDREPTVAGDLGHLGDCRQPAAGAVVSSSRNR